MKKAMCLCFLLFFVVSVYSQSNEIDISKIQEEIDQYGMPTISSVDLLNTNANMLYEEEKWKEAADAYALFAKNANWLANLISKGLEPYYSASSTDRKNISYSIIGALAKYEKKANYYKNLRNIAILRQGICFYKLNEYKTSLTYILKALDLIDIEELDQWEEARTILYDIVKYQ